MKDRATLRVLSQHIANWLHYGMCSTDEVEAALRRMAVKVNAQNVDDPNYRRLLRDGSLAFEAAIALVFGGAVQLKGYTEPLLHAFRRRTKALEGQGRYEHWAVP